MSSQPTLYFAVYNGMPGYMPNYSAAYSCSTLEEARNIMREEIDRFCEGGYARKALDFHLETFGNAGIDASNWHWTMAFAIEGTEELTLRGLTEDEYKLDEPED